MPDGRTKSIRRTDARRGFSVRADPQHILLPGCQSFDLFRRKSANLRVLGDGFPEAQQLSHFREEAILHALWNDAGVVDHPLDPPALEKGQDGMPDVVAAVDAAGVPKRRIPNDGCTRGNDRLVGSRVVGIRVGDLT